MIPSIGTSTVSSGRDILPNGLVVGTDGTATGLVWDSVGGSRQPIAGGAWAFTTVNGVGTRTVSGNPEIVISGFSAGWSATAYSQDGGTTWLQGVRASNVGKAPTGPVTGALACPGDDSWYVTFSSDGNGTNLYVEKDAGSPPALVARDAKGTTQKSAVQGLSKSGLAVGRRKGDSTNDWNYKLQYVGAGTPAAGYFKGLAGDNRGGAWSVNDDGSKIFGMSPVSDGRTGNWPYKYDVATGTATALALLGGVKGSATNGVPYGTTDNGRFAVGMEYRGVEKAVLWNTVNNNIIDLTDYAASAGILDGFTRLGRAYGVALTGGGQMLITGEGIWSPDCGVTLYTRGFSMTLDIPEPATLAFLALGGLALLRRRR